MAVLTSDNGCSGLPRLPGFAGENMAGMSAAGPRSASAGLVQQGLKEALIDTLTAILSPVQEVRAAAEEQIKVLEVTEGKLSMDCCIARPADVKRVK